MGSSADTGPRYRTLDHWRGIAALAVLLDHVYSPWLAAHPTVAPGWVATVIRHGWLGVELFFVISGYCITERLAAQYRSRSAAADFLFDRAWRLFPPYWAALFLTLVLRMAAEPFNQSQLTWNPVDWLCAPFLLETWLGRTPVLGVSWTLACEVFFYLVAGACLKIAYVSGRRWAGYLTALLVTPACVAAAGHFRLPALAYWPHFATGVALWFLVQFRVSARTITAGALIFGGTFCTSAFPWVVPPVAIQVSALFAFVLLVLHPMDSAILRLPFLRPLATVGMFSYSLYLIHQSIAGPMQNLLGRWWPPADPAGLLPLLCGVAAIFVAWSFYRRVEVPSETRRRARRRSPVIRPLAHEAL